MRALRAAVLLAFFGIGGRTLAGEGRPASGEGPSPSETEGVSRLAEPESPAVFEQRPFAFVVDPSTPGAGTVAMGYAVGVGSGISADRPIPVILQAAGLSNHLSVGYGVTGWLEPMAEVMAVSSNGSTVTSATLGVKFQLTAPDSPWRAAVLTGALREGASGANGAWLRASGSWRTGPVLVEANGYAERVFLPGRDSLDYAVMGGASYRVLGWLRLGAEYVGQDLEEMGLGGAEGGARQAVGPNLALDLDRGRYQIVATTLFGVGTQSPAAVVRVGLLGSY